jgi:hypothetical protein
VPVFGLFCRYTQARKKTERKIPNPLASNEITINFLKFRNITNPLVTMIVAINPQRIINAGAGFEIALLSGTSRIE